MNDNTKKIAVGAFIIALLALGSAGETITSTLTFIAGDNINITQSGNNITISSTSNISNNSIYLSRDHVVGQIPVDDGQNTSISERVWVGDVPVCSGGVGGKNILQFFGGTSWSCTFISTEPDNSKINKSDISVRANSNVTYVNFSNLTALSDGEFYELQFNVDNARAGFGLFGLAFDNDFTQSNYYVDYMAGSGTVISGDRFNLNIISSAGQGYDMSGMVTISRSPQGYIRSSGIIGRNTPSGLETFFVTHVSTSKTYTLKNISFFGHDTVSPSSYIGANSTFTLVRRG